MTSACKMSRSSTPGKKGCHTQWKPDLHVTTTDYGTSTSPPPPPTPPPPPHPLHQSSAISTQRDWRISNSFSRVLTLIDDRVIFKTASDIHTAIIAVHEQLEKNVTTVPRDTVRNQSEQDDVVVHPQQQSIGQAMLAVSFKEKP